MASGFPTGALERGINAPQWGLDNWIYFGRGHGAGTITGPYLSSPVRIGSTDFRIKPDGSAIEPITGATHTFGHAFTETGDRFTVTTSRPGLYVTPLNWSYLARNPNAAAPGGESSAGDYTRVFPRAAPHPWRAKRAEDPGFYRYYRDRYGASDSEAGGYFTSACGPLVYQDTLLPAEYRGQYFVCEPAQNLIHRAVIERDGPGLRLRRAPVEETSEFLASSDPWFHPIHLAHGPDGAIWIVDMYREIIEDYSAIPRYLQQQYGLTNGMNHGRLWRLTAEAAPRSAPANLAALATPALAAELGSPRYWRRQTARRLLIERQEISVAPALSRLARESAEPAAVLGALYALDGLSALEPEDISTALRHSNSAVHVHGLRLAERYLDSGPELFEQVLAMARDPDPAARLQLALTLGESRDPRALSALASLARASGEVKWMPEAILSSVHGRAGALMHDLLGAPDGLGQAAALLEPISASIGSGRDPLEIVFVLEAVSLLQDPALQRRCLQGLQTGLKDARDLALNDPGRSALDRLLANADADVRRLASALVRTVQIGDPVRRRALISQHRRQAADIALPVEGRLAAVTWLSLLDGSAATEALLSAWPESTPKVREALLEALFARHDRLPALLDALEQGRLPLAMLSAFQRRVLLESDRPEIRRRAEKLLNGKPRAGDATYRRFAAALGTPRNPVRGEQVFREHCATCVVETADGRSWNGVLASEGATSLTLRLPAGVEQIILRKDISRIATLAVSLMPEALVQTLEPGQVADVIAWLRGEFAPGSQPPDTVVLFDEDREFPMKLTAGDGGAAIEESDAFAGEVSLAIRPLQRHSANIRGWNYRITERPAPGEYRYLRFAWRSRTGAGVMLELAAGGRWPDARDPRRRYFAGTNTTAWAAREISPRPPRAWQTVTLDLWRDNGPFTLTGIAPTAMGGPAWFDQIELRRDLRDVEGPRRQ